MVFRMNSMPPEGQIDRYACWAASLDWWLRANNRPSTSQSDLLEEFKTFVDDDGGVSPTNLIQILSTPRFGMSIANYSLNDIVMIRNNGILPLAGGGPNYVVFKNFTYGIGVTGLHANVIIHDETGSDDPTRVFSMEPYFPGFPADPGQYAPQTGSYELRDINSFLIGEPFILGCP